MCTSVERGLEYLRVSQANAGFWSDWQLPPGESKMWTTAYIGYRLSSIPPWYDALIDEPLTRAQAWLRASKFPDASGWGYSEKTGPDADSTALALLFLRKRGGDPADGAALHAYQQTDGGFSTYTPTESYGAWVQSHAEVTATALLALLPTPFSRTRGMAAGMRYLQEHRRADGLWNSYWWVSCLYATQAALVILHAAGEEFDGGRMVSALSRVPVSNAFESALLLLCLLQLGDAGKPLAKAEARTLQAAQMPDGSWPSRPILRLTPREMSEPWLCQQSGPFFTDHKRLFTTSTVLAALAASGTA